MSGAIIKLVKPSCRHWCWHPFFTGKYGVGTIWQCKCGCTYELTSQFGDTWWAQVSDHTEVLDRTNGSLEDV